MGVSDFKSKILELVDQCSSDIDEKNLNQIESEYIKLIDQLSLRNNFSTIVNLNTQQSDQIKERIDLWALFGRFRKSADKLSPIPRLIVIGDIHCDYNALTGIFRKLCLSKYDYFGKAIFVFIGDYIDRGRLPLQTIRFLLNLKVLLGDRCVLLRGNHDQIKLNEENNKLFSEVRPAETVELFNEYLSFDARKKLKLFFDSLPYFATLDRDTKKILFVHGSIPRDEYSDIFNPDKIKNLEFSDQEDKTNDILKLLNSMLWGDPTNVKFKMNGSSIRFEFGSDQFEKFIKNNNFTNLIRGHEPVEFGYREMYDKRLITVFSSGGLANEHSYYNESVSYPSFLIIDEEANIKPESIFCHKLSFNISDQLFENPVIDKEKPSIYSFLLESNLIIDHDKSFDPKLKENVFLNSEFSIEIKSNNFPPLLMKDLVISNVKND